MLLGLEAVATQGEPTHQGTFLQVPQDPQARLMLLEANTQCMRGAISPDHHNTSWCLFAYLGDSTWHPHLPCTQDPMTAWVASISVLLIWEWCLLP